MLGKLALGKRDWQSRKLSGKFMVQCETLAQENRCQVLEEETFCPLVSAHTYLHRHVHLHAHLDFIYSF